MSANPKNNEIERSNKYLGSHNGSNSLRRISDKMVNIKDRADRIEQIKRQEMREKVILNAQESQTDDISGIFVKRCENEANLKEIEILKEKMDILIEELDSKEREIVSQKQIVSDNSIRMSECDKGLEKALDDLNRL